MNHKNIVRSIYHGFLHRDPAPAELSHWEKKLVAGLDLEEMLEKFLRTKEFSNIQKKTGRLFVEPGHFYSPIVNVDEVRAGFRAARSSPPSIAGIDISKDNHILVWRELVTHLKDIPFPEEKSSDCRYYFQNPAFSYGDGSILHAMLRRCRPKRLVEVGSGYSSACAIETIDRYLDGRVKVSFIEPYPELLLSLLGKESAECYAIHASTVQQADPQIFKDLEAGDFLFIDSTHVLKTGSDVCHELFNILPWLKPGVFIHFHDIFYPFEYGLQWVLEQNRSWNELYALRAFLMYNDAFEIIFWNDYFVRACRDVVKTDYPAMLKNSGGSIWLRKKR